MGLFEKKNTNICVGLDFKYHMKLSTSGILYLERLNQNIWIIKFDSVKKLQTSSSSFLCDWSTRINIICACFYSLWIFRIDTLQTITVCFRKKKTKTNTPTITSSTFNLSLARIRDIYLRLWLFATFIEDVYIRLMNEWMNEWIHSFIHSFIHS